VSTTRQGANNIREANKSGDANNRGDASITGKPETLEASVTEGTSIAVELAATGETHTSRDPRNETTALRKTATSGPKRQKRQKEHQETPTNIRDARIGGHNRDSTSAGE
jgi:hypothetical protein